MEWDQFGAPYDFPRFDGPPQTYLIASSPRSGSHYLGHLLFGIGRLGAPLEYFHPCHMLTWQQRLGTKSSEELIRALFARRTSPSGWFGAKSHWSQFEALLHSPTLLAILDFTQYIRISRRDNTLQAISLVIARQTQAWISFHTAQRQPVYDYQAICSAVAEIEEQDKQWKTYFESNSIAPLEVAYEDLILSPQQVVERVCTKFELPLEGASRKPASLPERQGSILNLEWRARFESDIESEPDNK